MLSWSEKNWVHVLPFSDFEPLPRYNHVHVPAQLYCPALNHTKLLDNVFCKRDSDGYFQWDIGTCSAMIVWTEPGILSRNMMISWPNPVVIVYRTFSDCSVLPRFVKATFNSGDQVWTEDVTTWAKHKLFSTINLICERHLMILIKGFLPSLDDEQWNINTKY